MKGIRGAGAIGRAARVAFALQLSWAAAAGTGCSTRRPEKSPAAERTRAERADPHASSDAIALAPHPGDHPLDEHIRKLQERVRRSRTPEHDLERLGWAFIARARELGDPGTYHLALATADAIEQRVPGSHAALLVRGHALHSLHRFAEAERVARRLVEERGLPFDHGLLGDVLIDRGEVDQAAAAYQQMMDARPDMHAYARAAHVRYLKGDLDAALEAMRMAARAASPRNRESFAWTWAKLAQYELQAQGAAAARASVERALAVFPDSQPALRMRALLELAAGDLERATDTLRDASARAPHPELLWLLADTLDAQDRRADAERVRARLLSTGESEDARTFALYLASRRERLELAERLAQAELEARPDVYSYEALAFVQSARGQHALALQNAHRSLAHGTPDPRLYYHAGMVAERAGAPELAVRWLARAREGSALLLPSQRAQLAARDDAREARTEVRRVHASARALRPTETTTTGRTR